MYAVDYWDNEYIQESMQAQGNNGYVGIDDHSKQILDRVPLYETFVCSV